MNNDKDNIVYHYTNTEAAFSILIPNHKNELNWLMGQILPLIKLVTDKPQIEKIDSVKNFITSKKFIEHGYSNKYFLLRALNIENMNDSREIIHGYEVLKKSNGNDINFDEAFKAVSQQKAGVSIFDIMKNNSYIISFSRIKNDLTQWRLYGDNGEGVAIGIDYNYLKNITETILSICVDNVSYGSLDEKIILEPKVSKEQVAKGKELEGELTSFQNELAMKLSKIQQIFLNIAFIKDKCFINEDECRLYVNPIIIQMFNQKNNFNIENFIFDYFDNEKKYMISKKKIVSYKEIPIPMDAIKEIWLGPKNNTEEHILNDYLKSLGYTGVKVIKSKLPYR
jgi:hypothetical protein